MPAQTAVRRQRDVAVGGGEHGVARRDDEVAGQCQGEARAGRRAFDGRDDRLGKGADRIDPVVQCLDALGLHRRVAVAIGRQALQRAAGAEPLAFADEDDAADLVAVLGAVERLDAGRVHLGAQRVALRGLERVSTIVRPSVVLFSSAVMGVFTLLGG